MVRLLLILLLASTSAVSAAQRAAMSADGLFDRLLFRNIGPAIMGGRIDDLAVLERNPSTFFAGAASGGLWRTVNNGTTWEAVFDNEAAASIGAVAITSASPSLVWVGTGEANNRQSSTWGAGVFKSTDGGRTWKNMGLTESKHVARIVIDPVDHDVVYVAAAGHLWGPNPERGVYKTSDGGLTWTRSLFVDDNSGATDLAMDPSNNKVLYAAVYQRQRSAWGFNGGGPGSGLFKSADAGRTWTKLTNGLPAGPLGRIGIDVYRRDSNIVYAVIQHEQESGLYRSSDAGMHWNKVSSTNPRPMYFSQVRIDPNDDHRIYVLGVRLNVSDDGGRTFSEVRVTPVRPGGNERTRDDMDLHAMWIDPGNSAHLITGSDVGVAASYDRGRTWAYMNNLPLGQFYHVGYDMDVPYRVYGGLQDNDVWSGPSAVRNRFGIGNRDWTTLAIGDGFVGFADPRDSRTIYAETQNGNIVRVDRYTNERKTIKPQAAQGDPELRWAWDAPLIISPHDPNTILTAANKVFRSKDRGNSWETISGDLTSGVDRETLQLMGVGGKDITISKNDGISSYPTIVSLAESPRKAGVYYAGADDGTAQVTTDGGRTWANVSTNFPDRPRGGSARIVASAFDDGTAYAIFNNHANDDYRPYVYATTNFGKSWSSVAGTLPDGHVVNCITEDPVNPNVLYVGTEFGLFVTIDRGQRWTRLKNNLPTVPVDEITIHSRDNDMLVATHGRSIWILDDLTPIQQAAEAQKSSAYLFGSKPAFPFNPSGDFASYHGDGEFWGRNPEFGIPLSYYLNQSAQDVKLAIRNMTGALVREIGNEDLRNLRGAAVNRTHWDLRYQPVDALRVRPQGAAAAAAGERGGGFGGAAGGGSPAPFVLPGDYRVTLSVEGRDVGTRTIRVQNDPLIEISDAERKTQHDTALALHRLLRSMNDAGAAAVAALDQIRSIQELLKLLASVPPAVTTAADTLSRRIADVARQVGVQGLGGGDGAQLLRNRVTTTKAQIMASTSLPTAQQMQSARESGAEFTKLVADLNDALSAGLPALYKTLGENNVHPPPMKAIAPVRP
jgi:photosystem II stability/assembly factor-like uncharacterized protein